MGKVKKIPLKRRRLEKTNYRKRLKLLLSHKPRLVVRKTNRYIISHIVFYDYKAHKDLTKVYVNSKELLKYGWNYSSFKNLPACYLTGLLIGKKALKNNITEAVLDMGLNKSTKGNRIYAVLKGALDAGLKVPYSKEILPTEDRIKGLHIKGFDQNLFLKVKENILKEYGGSG